ncbi:hypothetical protein HPO96_10685 [Kribbella sandramycini]|uniref:Resolvase/invertase-type recombinase catalytic domain-containing protein n=1 Tax=Kribbella sandramycini TaxID=60450 RepID=A0A7Y4KZU2_9ACTN|nr:hypothetical protein [Kribbella sandramycini]MBB6569454.1 hypothetical protein [Kribbella sandramycini]NOL40711.1 hypothetical protein [Kribbella sandramycini]
MTSSELYGFLHEDAFTSARQADDARSRMAAFAERWDFRLTKVYAEVGGNASSAFEQLREAVNEHGVPVVVHSAAHLAPYGDVRTILNELEEPSGLPVMASEAY